MVVVLIVVSVIVAALLLSGGSGARQPSSGNSENPLGGNKVGPTVQKNTVDEAATPKGWVTVDYGYAQVSIPQPMWSRPQGCAGGSYKEVIAIDMGVTLAGTPTCQGPRGTTTLIFGNTTSTTDEAGKWIDLNGIRVYMSHLDADPATTVLTVPTLNVGVRASGPLAERVLGTLTVSPRFVALAKGDVPTIPHSWRRVSYGGLSIAVPDSWPRGFDDLWYECDENVLSFGMPGVVLDDGSAAALGVSCSSQAPIFGAPSSGLMIDPGPSRFGLDRATVGSCQLINGLSVCPATSDPFGVLVLAVHVPGKIRPVEVDIGLTGSGETARTILYSIEKP